MIGMEEEVQSTSAKLNKVGIKNEGGQKTNGCLT